mmetsp:Transcript_27022/g.40749  ORF Transcript_27022/g.40749 Transcript_27022/m.40749 type:complete len:101 (+) Transcript_27022:186-488(+)
MATPSPSTPGGAAQASSGDIHGVLVVAQLTNEINPLATGNRCVGRIVNLGTGSTVCTQLKMTREFRSCASLGKPARKATFVAYSIEKPSRGSMCSCVRMR